VVPGAYAYGGEGAADVGDDVVEVEIAAILGMNVSNLRRYEVFPYIFLLSWWEEARCERGSYRKESLHDFGADAQDYGADEDGELNVATTIRFYYPVET
jgi:hypothetical protein